MNASKPAGSVELRTIAPLSPHGLISRIGWAGGRGRLALVTVGLDVAIVDLNEQLYSWLELNCRGVFEDISLSGTNSNGS